jgi:phosphohistidine phosphatase
MPMQLQSLYIARHAPAEEFHPEHPGEDAPRRLTSTGEALAQQMFAALRALGHSPEAIATSPLVRTRQTAEAARHAFHVRQPVELMPALAPHGSQAEVLAHLQTCPHRSLMLVGHEPGVSDLVSALAARGHVQQIFERAGVAYLRVHELGDKVRGELVFFAPPSLLGLEE